MDNPIILVAVIILLLTVMTIINVEWWAPWNPGLFSFIWRSKKSQRKIWTKKERSAYRIKAYAIRIATAIIFITIIVISYGRGSEEPAISEFRGMMERMLSMR